MFRDIERVGSAGLGAMGAGIAERLLGAGYDVVGWNRTRAKAQPLLDMGMGWADSPRELAASADVLSSPPAVSACPRATSSSRAPSGRPRTSAPDSASRSRSLRSGCSRSS
jgi:NAD(P)-dependent dehydrogenase (short-subunit alcohol dehydrogenase family)